MSKPSDPDPPLPQKRPTTSAKAADTIVSVTARNNNLPAVLARNPWLIYVLPLAMFMLVGALEPKPPAAGAADDGAQASAWELPYRYYPLVYTLKIALTVAAIAFVWPGYRQFPLRLTAWSIAAGVIGAVIWIGLCTLRLEEQLLAPLGLDTLLGLGTRSAFNPLEQLAGNPAWAYGFLTIRLLGLVIVVPLIEEFFLRGFLMRFFVRPDWWNVPFGDVNVTALAIGTLVPMAMHPGELLAAAAWFSLITLLMVKTRNIWDCVAAHAITNLLLGIYVLATGEWSLM